MLTENQSSQRVPDGWKVSSIASTAVSEAGFVDGDWIESPYIVDSGIRLVQTGNIGVGRFIERSDFRKYITERSFAELGCKWVEPGDILICRLADPVGRACIVPDHVGRCVTAVDCTIYRPNPEAVDRNYVVHFLNSNWSLQRASDVSGGTTRQRISRRNLGNLPLFLPSLPEQRRIAEILDTVDEAIQQTEAVIAKLKQIKTGLLHDLLTRGIDEHDQLRDPIAHPEQFKDSPLGRIPRAWEIASLDSISHFVTSGSRGWAPFYADSGPLFLRIGNLTREHLNLRFDSVIHVQPPAGSEGSRTSVQPGDLLVSITADLGIIGVVPDDLGEAYVNQHIALTRLDKGRVNPRWIGNYLSVGVGQRQFYLLDDPGAKAGLNLPTVRGILVALPSQREQDHIIGVLDCVDRQISSEVRCRNKMQDVKSGLMSNLLQGRVQLRAGTQEETNIRGRLPRQSSGS